MADILPPVEVTAQRVSDIVEKAPPAKQEASQVSNRAKEAMLKTMSGMEEARERIGNFCVTIGEPGDPQRAVILATPIREPYTPEEIKEANRYRHSGETSSLTYVMATADQGFRKLDFYNGRMVHAYTPKHTPRQEGDAFSSIIEQAVRGIGIVDKADGYVIGQQVTIHPNTDDSMQFRFQEVDSALVEKAVRVSIDVAQQTAQPTIDRSKITMQTAQAVQKQVGMEISEVADQATQQGIVNARKGLRGLFGRK